MVPLNVDSQLLGFAGSNLSNLNLGCLYPVPCIRSGSGIAV
jgi:hypothetical protein